MKKEPIKEAIADKGWNAMQPILDTHLPVHKKENRMGLIVISCGLACLMALAIYIYFLHRSNDHQMNPIKDNTHKADVQISEFKIQPTPSNTDSLSSSLYSNPSKSIKLQANSKQVISDQAKVDSPEKLASLHQQNQPLVREKIRSSLISKFNAKDLSKPQSSIPSTSSQQISASNVTYAEQTTTTRNNEIGILQEVPTHEMTNGLTVFNAPIKEVDKMLALASHSISSNITSDYPLSGIPSFRVLKRIGPLKIKSNSFGCAAAIILEYDHNSKNFGSGLGLDFIHKMTSRWHFSIAPALIFQSNDSKLQSKELWFAENNVLFDPKTSSPLDLSKLKKTNSYHIDIFPTMSYFITPKSSFYTGAGYSFMNYKIKTNQNYIDATTHQVVNSSTTISHYEKHGFGILVGFRYSFIKLWSVQWQSECKWQFSSSKGASNGTLDSSIGIRYNFEY